jgi:ligand-binding sensor domain-containing protein
LLGKSRKISVNFLPDYSICISIFSPMKMRLVLFLLLSCSFKSFSQQKEFEFKNFTQEDGLPSNESYFVYRDSRNFLWIATDQGIVRYNGNKMERFDLPDNVVFKIYEDSKGRIWFFSHTGKLSYFYKERIYAYKYNDNITKALKTIIISNAYVNDEDEIIINAAYHNIRISAKGVITTNFYDQHKDSNSFTITPINNDAKQFFAQLNQVNYWEQSTVYINLRVRDTLITYKIPFLPGSNSQYSCITNNGKDFYFFYGKNLVKLNENGTYKNIYLPAVITSLEIDKEGIWAGFIKYGAALLDTGLNVLYNDPTLKDKSVTSIRKDYEGGIWFSTLEKGVFYLKNPLIKHFIGHKTLTHPVFRMFKTGDSSLLFTNSTGIFRLKNDHVFTVLAGSYDKITDMFIDDNKNILIAGIHYTKFCQAGEYVKTHDANYRKAFFFSSNSEIITVQKNNYAVNSYAGLLGYNVSYQIENNLNNGCFDPVTLKLNNSPGILFSDTKKQLWLGTIKALYRYNSVNGIPEFTAHPVQFKPHDSLFNKGITCMRQMNNNIYTIGIRFGGITLMQDTTVIATITEKEGLLSNSVKYLLPIKDQLWAATASGISVISFQSYVPIKFTITNIGKNEGLYNVNINQLMANGQSILAATSSGIYEVANAGQLLNNKPKPVYFYINSVTTYKGDTSEINTITLPFRNNRVVIKYSAVCFNLPEEIKYYYRFDNADTVWHEITSTELLLENLIPGTYNLKIKAAIQGEHRFSETKELQIIVEKPWWQNNWLKLLGVIIALGIVYFFIQYRIKKISGRENQNAVLRTRMVELEQTALRSQMNPHFIFNCLTSIQQLIISGHKTDANEYLVKFARLIRKTLDLSASSFITVEEEADYLKEYLVLEQLRIPGQFEFSVKIDANINAQTTEIPGMMLQPIIENSIRHGIKHLENKNGRIDISLKQQDEYILCTITDNGVGRAKSGASKGSSFRENKSYGMEIVARRLSAISFHHENEGKLDVEDLFNKDGTPAGTTVTMQLPFKIKQL